MSFQSYTFLFLLLPVAVAGWWLLNWRGHGKLAQGFLLLVSLAFYGKARLAFLSILLGSILFNFGVGKGLQTFARYQKGLLALGLLGFRDDYLKVAKKTSDGISARKKLLVQFLAGLAGVTFLYLYPEGSPRVELHDYISSLFIPFYGQVNLPWFVYIPFGVVVVMSASNAVNLTDGLDGLASGCSVATGITYAIIAVLCGSWLTADSLDIPFHPGAGEISVFMMALVGACLGFLWHNCYPAKVFMGDTGSLALGGAFGMAAVCTAQELLFIVIGGVFVMEAVSVVLQVGSYKLRHGKRIFAMAPIHHHFELKGWKETQVIARFWMISLLLAFLGLFLITTA